MKALKYYGGKVLRGKREDPPIETKQGDCP